MISVDRVKAEEIPQVKELLSYVWKDTYVSFLPEKIIKLATTKWHDPELLLQQSQQPDVFFATAKDTQETIIGLITIRRQNDGSLFINRLYVHPGQQRKGVGKQLLEEAIKIFPDAQKIVLHVEEQNTKGVNFYKKNEFKITGKEIEKIEDVSMPVLVMEKVTL